MPDLSAEAVQRLGLASVRVDRGPSDEEKTRVQETLGFTFGPEHREFIQSVLPVGKSWPDWRRDSDRDVRGRLDWAVERVLFDVHNNAFWPASWGDRSDGRQEREREARAHLAQVTRLVPVYSHRYLTSDPQFRPSPVFSIHQADVIFYGDDLLEYVAHEFDVPPLHPSDRTHVPFWSKLAEGAENRDL